MNGAAKAASVDKPIAGLPAASAMPRAAAMPTRKPVKLPGPMVTAMRSRAAEVEPGAIEHARDQRHQSLGMAALHRQQFMHARFGALGVEYTDRTGLERGIDGKDTHKSSLTLFCGVIAGLAALNAEVCWGRLAMRSRLSGRGAS